MEGERRIVFIDWIWIGMLCTISYIDWKEKRIPNKWIWGIAACAGIQMCFLGKEEIVLRLAGMGSGIMLFFLILMIVPGAFGGGDIKLSAANGLYLGLVPWLRSFAIAVMAAAIYILYMACRQQKIRGEEIAFGPFLCVGAVLSFFVL